MLINKLVLNNFFRFYGRQEIIFSNDEKRNVTIIRGDNGTGKTTLLNAFSWGFYGNLTEPLTENNMINYLKAKELKEGQIAEVFVEIEFEDKGRRYTINRSQDFIKRDDQVIRIGQSKLTITYTNDKGNEVRIDYPETFFEGIIPEQLRGFFFFDGERINRLAQNNGKEEIKKAILDILGLTTLELINGDLDKINEELSKDIRKYLKGLEADINDEYLAKLGERENLKQELDELKNKEKLIKTNLDEIENKLLKFNSEVIKEKQTERKKLELEIKKEEERLENLNKDLINHVSKNFKLYLIWQYIHKVLELLEDKRKKGELPSDIKKQFVKDLLERKRCICGRHLIEGTEEYKTVENLMRVAGETELDSAYIRLTAFINEVDEFKKNNAFYRVFSDIINEEIKIKDDIEHKKLRIKEINDELKNSSEEEIRQLENLREIYLNDLQEKSRMIGRILNKLEEVEKEIETLEKELKKLKMENEQAKKLEKQRELVQLLGQLNREIQEAFVKITREKLDKKIGEVFASLSRKPYRKAVLTDNFELKIISELNEDMDSEILSTGEGQIASLSFIGALVAYSREKINSRILSDFAGGDFPIVMDSPFGYLDNIHTANVAANIGKLASQVIIIVSDKQWSKDVEENIYHQVGKMYKMEDGEMNSGIKAEYTIVKEMMI